MFGCVVIKIGIRFSLMQIENEYCPILNRFSPVF